MEKNENEWAEVVPDLPLSILYVGGRYLLFDVKAAAWLRREHNVCGYNVGTLPQAPSQNIFLGVPIMIMPEEAQILVDKGVAYVIDDARAHDQAMYDRRTRAHEEAYLDEIRRQASEVEEQRAREHIEAKERALSKRNTKTKDKPKTRRKQEQQKEEQQQQLFIDDQQVSVPDPDNHHNNSTTVSESSNKVQYHITPTNSHQLVQTSPPPATTATTAPDSSTTALLIPSKGKLLPGLPTSYPLFRHLHSRGFFMTPGLRFGCQYSTYPGDPLRYHSHFLSVGVEWTQELDLMDLVGGGRLGTGVKKGFLIGGVEPLASSSTSSSPLQDEEEQGATTARVRTFTLEWAVM